MNVKLNQKIAELQNVEYLTITPSCADESTVLGGCYYGYQKYCKENNLPLNIKPLNHLYLVNEYSDKQIDEFIAEAVLALEMGADAADIGLTIHPHPTLSESFAFAAEMIEGTITDLYVKK